MPSRPGAKEVRLGSFRLAESDIIGPPPPTEVTIPIAASDRDGWMRRLSAATEYPPAGVIQVFLTAIATTARKLWSSGSGAQIGVGHLIFDTSALPDNAIISAANLVMKVFETSGVSAGRTLDFEYYDHAGAIDSADYTENVGTTAGSVPAATWGPLAVGDTLTIPLSSPTSISRTGVTGIRFGMSGGQPANTQDIRIGFCSWDHATEPEAQLVITYTVPITYFGTVSLPVTFGKEVAGISSAGSQKLRPIADIDAADWSVAPLWSKIDEETADGTVITGVAS